jgi:hypothetical protein
MFDVQVVLDKSDLLAYVERAGGEPEGGGNRYACACPLHGGDNPTAFSMYFQDGRWKWKCFTGDCGGGDAITFVEVWQGFSETERDGRKLSIFQQACEWIMGGQMEDSRWMKKSAEKRLEAARLERIAAQEREEARRIELRVAELHVRYHNEMTPFHRDEWTKAGIDEGMQDFWTLGGKADFEYWIDGTMYHTPTLTIPIFNERRELMTIQHRLINPHNPHDKYRPERKGLHAHPFLAMPEMGYDGGIVWVMEGAKKAMVTWTRSDSSDWQCIGLPSQESYKGMIELLQPVGSRVVVVPDPNTERNKQSLVKAYHLAKAIGGKFLQLPQKIDDLILQTGIVQNDLFKMQLQARRV